MPDRMIRESITTSRSLAACPLFADLLFPRLLVLADNHGRFDAEPRIVCARLFPLRDDVSPKQIAEVLDQLEHEGMIRRWWARGIHVAEFVSFDRHQTQAARFRKKRSSLPDPDAKHGESPSAPATPRESQSASEIPSMERRGEGEECERRDAGASSHTPSEPPLPTLTPSDPLFAAAERLTGGTVGDGDRRRIVAARAEGVTDATILAAFSDPHAVEKRSVAYALKIAADWQANGGPPKRIASGRNGRSSEPKHVHPPMYVPGEDTL